MKRRILDDVWVCDSVNAFLVVDVELEAETGSSKCRIMEIGVQSQFYPDFEECGRQNWKGFPYVEACSRSDEFVQQKNRNVH
mmetsp:Transcript_7845/g.14236  ORF Transcript_7845/g.14236 Transcript_7845/m.14236 type:complete len:82 (+) Transcript_7845:1964-2209(+)